MDDQKKLQESVQPAAQPEEQIAAAPSMDEAETTAEHEFLVQREKRIESFVLNLSDEDLAKDPEPPVNNNPEQQAAPVKAAVKTTKPRKERPLVRRKKNSWMYSTLYLCVIVAIGVAVGSFFASGINDLLGASRSEKEVTITIDPNMSDRQIVKHLKEVGAIREPFFFTLYAKVTGATYKPGTYVIAGNADYELINNSLKGTANRIDTVKVTFIEGWTLEQFAAKLEENLVCDADEFLAAVNEEDFTNYKFIKAIPDADKRAYALEGYLFPDTYEFYKYSTPKTVIRKILNNVNNYVLTKEVYDKAEALGMTVDEVLTLASIIQKEVNNKEDMGKVSSAFHNRLKNWGANAKLQSDVTYFYEQNVGKDYAGLYDTYVCVGLPIGPICNPSRMAIQAALNPTKTNYYYFVSDVNGKTYYASTLDQHNKNIAYAETVKPIEPDEEGTTSGATEGD